MTDRDNFMTSSPPPVIPTGAAQRKETTSATALRTAG